MYSIKKYCPRDELDVNDVFTVKVMLMLFLALANICKFSYRLTLWYEEQRAQQVRLLGLLIAGSESIFFPLRLVF